jgi:hypothetical protein
VAARGARAAGQAHAPAVAGSRKLKGLHGARHALPSSAAASAALRRRWRWNDGARKLYICEQSPALNEIGAGLNLSPNALMALRDLGVEDAVIALGSESDFLIIDRADAGHDLTLGQMPVAHQPPAAIIGELVGMAAEQPRNLGLEGLRQATPLLGPCAGTSNRKG